MLNVFRCILEICKSHLEKEKRPHANVVANGILYNSSIENDWQAKEKKIQTENQKQIATKKKLFKNAISLF